MWSFTTYTGGGLPCVGMPTVTYVGKVYNTVQIRSQCWLREILDVGKMVLGSANQTNNDTIEKYCYDNNPPNCATYGGLYQSDEAMQYVATPGTRGICPPGWHIPMLAEFQTLRDTVLGDGNALKAIGQGTGAGAGTNTSGFSALLAGYRHRDGSFGSLGYHVDFWSSIHADAPRARSLYLDYDDAYITLRYSFRANGFSVRCLKD